MFDDIDDKLLDELEDELNALYSARDAAHDRGDVEKVERLKHLIAELEDEIEEQLPLRWRR